MTDAGPSPIPTYTPTGDSEAYPWERFIDAERGELAKVIWEASRADESTISAMGAGIVAAAVLAAGFCRPASECPACGADGRFCCLYNTARRGATDDTEVLPGDSAPCGCVLGDDEGPSRPCAEHRAEAVASNARPATGDTPYSNATSTPTVQVGDQVAATGDTLTDAERFALLRAVEQQTSIPGPRNESDLSSVRGLVEQAVERILADRR